MGIVGDWHHLYTSHGVREGNARFLTFIALFGGLGTCTVGLVFGLWLLWNDNEDATAQVIGAVFSAVSIATGLVRLVGPKIEGRAWWPLAAGWFGPGAVAAPFSPYLQSFYWCGLCS